MRKKFIFGIAAVILIAVVFIWQSSARLNEITTKLVENVASDVLQTRVIASGLSIDMKRGKADIEALSIVNPEGYFRKYIVEMRAIEVDFEPDFIQKNILVIKSLRINRPKISYQLDRSGISNMNVLMKSIETTLDEANPSARDGNLKIIITKLEITEGRIRIDSPAAPGEITFIELPAIEVTDIGRSQGGVRKEEATGLVIGELVRAVITTTKVGVDRVRKNRKRHWLDALRDDVRPKGR